MAKKTGILVPVKLSEELAEFIGKPKESRGNIMKAIWKYIKKDKKRRQAGRTIKPKGNKLEALLGKKEIDMFSMVKLLNKKHILKD